MSVRDVSCVHLRGGKEMYKKSPWMQHTDPPRRPQPRPHHACRGKQQQRRCSCSLASAPWGAASPALLSSVSPEGRLSRPHDLRLSVCHGAKGGWACNGARVAASPATSLRQRARSSQALLFAIIDPLCGFFWSPVTPRHLDPRCRQAARPHDRTRLSSHTSMCVDRENK